MPEPLTIAGAGLAFLGSKDILTKLLGPTADYLGAEAKGLVEKCNINLDTVFAKAARKLGKRMDDPGAVSPRVLRHILDDARFCEDEVAAEYYGGMLAGSREVTGKDDQCLPYLSKVKQMSVYQIRLHFAFYYEVLRHHKSSQLNMGLGNDLPNAGLLLPHEFLIHLFPPEKLKDYWKLMTHCVVGLSSHGLINTYSYGEASHLKQRFPNAESDGAYMEPNFTGAELFLWALGVESPNGHDFFQINIDDIEKVIPIPHGAMAK
ncbi:hypothetical protein L4X63_21195 [Geomonas sp. Red32]|uniref:hypothetical protein n=1 Tax=Geomonas sp. Red32 TaxID=2912856 RepID=UPI00202CCA80|nr:hypothetical protein [Geomonas sp. Red32]MCM0084102.1 hypothetical protein [Geomonas sp. Red32]